MQQFVLTLGFLSLYSVCYAADSSRLEVPVNISPKQETLTQSYFDSEDKLNFNCGDIHTQGDRGVSAYNIPQYNCTQFSIDYK